MQEEKQEEEKVAELEFDDSGRCLKCDRLAGGDPNHKCFEVEVIAGQQYRFLQSVGFKTGTVIEIKRTYENTEVKKAIVVFTELGKTQEHENSFWAFGEMLKNKNIEMITDACEEDIPNMPDGEDITHAHEVNPEETPVEPVEAAQPQLELFQGVKRVEKKMKKGKKITQQEAFRVMVELKDAVTHLDGRLQYVATVMQMLDDGVMKIHANISVLAAVLEDKEIVTPEECEAKYLELKAESEARLKAEKEAAEKAEEHPDCHYCGKEDCKFCNASKEEEPKQDITDAREVNPLAEEK